MDILSNPEMLQKITAIASGVSSGQNAPSPPPVAESTPASISSGFSGSGVNMLSGMTSNSKAELLLAIKPFLKETKRGKIDAVVKALTVSAAISQIKGGGIKNV